MQTVTVLFSLKATDPLAAVTWADQMAEDTDHHPDVEETEHRVLDPLTGRQADKRGKWLSAPPDGKEHSQLWLDAYDYGYVAGKHGIFTSNPFDNLANTDHQEMHEGWANGYVQGGIDRDKESR